jgi:hypothetical protein
MVARQKSIILDFSIVRGPGNENAGGGDKQGRAGSEKQGGPRVRQPVQQAKRSAVDTRRTERETPAVVARDEVPGAKSFTGLTRRGR